MSSSNYDSLYSKAYYASFAGWDRRLQELAKLVPPMFQHARILDVGCGAGDWVGYLANQGYRVTGIDYSPDAIALCKKHQGNFRVMPATKLTFLKNSFDAVFCLEVAEHLTQTDLIKSLKEIRRVLKPGGFLFLHTEPNRTFNDCFYRYWAYPVGSILIWLNNLLGNHYSPMVKPNEIRSEINKKIHINEPTYFSLKNALKRAGFNGLLQSTNLVWRKPILSWKDWVFNLLVYLDPISRWWPLNILAGQDFLVITKKT